MTTHNTSIDVMVVGGGLAGLTAACYLARGGVNVTLFEKASMLGGRAATQKHDGYRLNRGIHALYSGGAASSVLAELGIPYSGASPKVIHALRGGELYTAPVGAMSMLTTRLLDVADKLALMRLFTLIPRLQARELRDQSVEEWLDSNISRPRVRELMAANARTFVYSSALDLVSADVFILKTQLALKHPVVYIDGGWETLVQGLRSFAERAGARIRIGSNVTALERGDGRVHGIKLGDGSAVRADAVIIATSAKDAVTLVDSDDGAPLRTIAERLVPAQVACLDVALSRLPNPRYTVVQDLEHPRFMSTQSLYSRVAPKGGAVIYTFKQLDPRRKSDPRDDERELEELLDITQAGWREALVKRQYLPRIEAVGMLPLARSGGYVSRPQFRVPGIVNLYLAGDWIGEGFLADPSMGSAREIAQLLLSRSAPGERS